MPEVHTLPFAPASERNKLPIGESVVPRFPDTGTVLEIGAGTGQHAVHLSGLLKHLDWQASDHPDQLGTLQQRVPGEGGTNLLPPIALDVLQPDWPVGPYQAAYSANTAHIMHWPAVQAMFSGLGQVLEVGAPFALYGPFNQSGDYTSASNRDFDLSLKQRDPGMGLRDLESLELLAADHHMKLEEILPMPANNFLLFFRR